MTASKFTLDGIRLSEINLCRLEFRSTDGGTLTVKPYGEKTATTVSLESVARMIHGQRIRGKV